MLTIANQFQLLTMRRVKDLALSSINGREELGGKAQGLLSVHQTIAEIDSTSFPQIRIDIPELIVIGTSVFDAFMTQNDLFEIALSDQTDARIANAFQRADLPFEILGQLRSISDTWLTPLAVRSSGLLEDITQRPFAGVYQTKMIPNNQSDPNARFLKMVEAIKLVWASTYFKIAKDYCLATRLDIRKEKMAVILQEVIGTRHQNRFYPELSGVARSYNYYPLKPAKPEDGVVNLALGLGKTIVDGSRCWFYSPAYPEMPPPFNSMDELLNETQTEFWMIDMGEQVEYDPINENEYIHLDHLQTAEKDGALVHLGSTFDPQSERLSIGMGNQGIRVLTFSPLLAMKEYSFNTLMMQMLSSCESSLGCPVEIEFAMTFNPPRFGFLQVRPMVVPESEVVISSSEMQSKRTLAASESALGHGVLENVRDIVYVNPEHFDLKHSRQIAEELAAHNRRLLEEDRPYLLIVFGRLGTKDPWLGIPVTWGQICGANVIIEATLPNARVELSQGSHYFHNIINLGVKHFSVPFNSPYPIDWDWLSQSTPTNSIPFTCHIRLSQSLLIKVDGRHGRGIILHP